MIYAYAILLSLCLVSFSRTFLKLSQMLDSVNQKFYQQFKKIDYHTLSHQDLGQYICLYGKAHLYGMLQENSKHSILHGFTFIKIAAESFQVPQCMHLLAIMHNFKMTPHFNLEGQVFNNSVLQQYVRKSHLKNSQIFWYLASLKDYMPSTMVLGNLNHVGLSTRTNCTTAAMYYRLVIQKIFVEQYEKHGYYRDRTSLFEQQLYLKKKLSLQQEATDAYMIEQTLNFGQESYTSNLILAQNYFYGRNGFLRNVTKAAEMFQKLKQVGNLESAALLGLCYFKGQGVKKDYKKAYQLFRSAKNSDLSKYMINIMQYYGVYIKKNKQAVLKRLKTQIKQSYHAKGFYGSLIIKGDIPSEQKMTGMVLLQESSNYGFSVSKLILGITYLDGIDISYNCPKAVNLIRDGLLSVDVWADKSQEAKIAIKKGKYIFALMKYLELSLTGSSIGLVNGLYLLQMYLKELSSQSWNSKLVQSNPLFQYLQTRIQSLNSDSLLFGDLLQIVSKQEIQQSLLNSTKDYLSYVRNKILTICKNGGVSICMFLFYKENLNDKALLRQLAKREGQKLHIKEARFLLGQLYQKQNNTEQAITQYSKATSSFLAPLLLIIEGYELQFNILDDLLWLLTILAIMVAGSVIHRNMILLKKHKEQMKNQQREENSQQQQQNEDNQQQNGRKQMVRENQQDHKQD